MGYVKYIQSVMFSFDTCLFCVSMYFLENVFIFSVSVVKMQITAKSYFSWEKVVALRRT